MSNEKTTEEEVDASLKRMRNFFKNGVRKEFNAGLDSEKHQMMKDHDVWWRKSYELALEMHKEQLDLYRVQTRLMERHANVMDIISDSLQNINIALRR